MKTVESKKELALRFSPTAYAKLVFIRDRQDAEVGGFGIASANDPLLITDIALIKQEVTSVTVKFDDADVADYIDEMVDQKIPLEQCTRIWIHTHPGTSPNPSVVDEETFARVFGKLHWSVMFIIAKDGSTYARLQYGVGPGGSIDIPVRVDYSQPFAATDHTEWKAEFEARVIRGNFQNTALAAHTTTVKPKASDKQSAGSLVQDRWEKYWEEEYGPRGGFADDVPTVDRETMIEVLLAFGYTAEELAIMEDDDVENEFETATNLGDDNEQTSSVSNSTINTEEDEDEIHIG